MIVHLFEEDNSLLLLKQPWCKGILLILGVGITGYQGQKVYSLAVKEKWLVDSRGEQEMI